MLLRRAWQSIINRLTGGGRKTPIQKLRRSRPLVEALEDRVVPANWFVSTLGSDGNPGTIPAPFATIQHAVNVAASGDRIHVATGIYGYVGADRLGDDPRFNSPGNYAQGNNPGGVGGSAAGAAVSLRFVGNLTLDHVTFDTNLSQGGSGVNKGGDALGAGVHLDHSSVTGNTITLYNNRAVSGGA